MDIVDDMEGIHQTPAVSASDGNNAKTYRPRGYQLEMLEASLQQNIIVAMDTGSGKTQIAVMRIMAELEKGGPGKLVWFLAPTVALCLQQHGVIASQIPSAKTRTLTGSDNVDRWTEQSTWDTALQGLHVVVSTHAVLADGLSHGFIKISQLSLIVFDEGKTSPKREFETNDH
ncbi:Dicer-like protein 2 [Penicillium verhagenii]|nr:Dicer-like protein 2 [Penicillium verhagenii]